MHRLSDDRGAVAVLMAVLLPTVLLGMGVLVIDLGQGYAEKRQLQNGADAAAIAVAREHARAGTACTAGARADTARTYADANANDAAGSAVQSVTCPATQRVRVTTRTASADGGVLRPFLAQVLGGEPFTVRAAATAAWGTPTAMTSDLPITVSRCELDFYTGGGTALQPPPTPYRPDAAIPFHSTSGSPSGCPASSSGADLPGGFGWLQPTGPSGTCTAETAQGDWADDKTGVAVPGTDCRTGLAALHGKVVRLPVYDRVNGLNGTNGQYRISGYAAFVLTGYRFPGETRSSLWSGTDYCGPKGSPALRNTTCLYGYFTTAQTVGSGTVGAGPSYGVTVTQLVD